MSKGFALSLSGGVELQARKIPQMKQPAFGLFYEATNQFVALGEFISEDDAAALGQVFKERVLIVVPQQAAKELPVHRTEAGWPDCGTCDGGGCLDCTDPA